MMCAESDPFAPVQSFGAVSRGAVHIVGRLQAMWESFRELVIENSPKVPGRPKDRQGYLRSVNDILQE